MSTDSLPTDSLDRFRALLERSDAALVLAVMAGFYLLFLGIGAILNYDLAGLISILGQVTFFTTVYALVVLALNLHWGYAGLFNIGIAGFMAVGVYTMAMLTAPPTASPPGLGLPLAVGVVGGMVAAALVGLLTAMPALRLRADYLAIVTVAISEIIRLTYNSPAFSTFTLPGGIALGTGGASGIGTFPSNPVRGIYYVNPASASSGTTPIGAAVFGFFENTLGIFRSAVIVDLTYGLVLVVIVFLVYTLLARVGNSPFGRVLKAIREDEVVAKSLGKDTNRFKIKTFMLGCALMGLAGVVWQGFGTGAVYPQAFRPELTFYIFIAVIIGGAGSNTGSVLGGAVFANLLFLLPQYLPNIIEQTFAIQASPNTFIAAVTPIAAGEIAPLLGYVLNQRLPALRFVFVGVLLVYLMQNRPEGLLGHRTETAAAVDLTENHRSGAGPEQTPDASGVADGEGGIDDE
ncbi:MAG: ABC-type branched-chain amino acid transport system, permease component [Halonotius sp. J07HN6]|nr:MAG: ABC-type branched-chain amino acid transport system, permease component [Halonotius sp. J07HN6]